MSATDVATAAALQKKYDASRAPTYAGLHAADLVYKQAETLVEQVEAGLAPWQIPRTAGEPFLPFNPVTGQDYSAANAITLMSQAQDRGFSDTRWMTSRQAERDGAQVREGERSASIEFWKWEGHEPVLDELGRATKDEHGLPVTQLVRYEEPQVWATAVFNAEQIDGLQPFSSRQATINAADLAPLNQDIKLPVGSEGHAKERLKIEIATMILGSQRGIGYQPARNATEASLQAKAMRIDPRELFRAGADAEKLVAEVKQAEQARIVEQEKARISVTQHANTLNRTVDVAVKELTDQPRLAESFNLGLSGSLVDSRTKITELTPVLEKDLAVNNPLRLGLWDRSIERIETAWDKFGSALSMHTPNQEEPDKWAMLRRDLEHAGKPTLRDRLEDLAERFGKAIGYIQELPDLDQEQTVSEPVTTATIDIIQDPEPTPPTFIRGDHPSLHTPADERIYLAVPFAEKDDAKQAGAKWDKDAKSWYAPPGVALDGLAAWIPAKDNVHVAATQEPREEFAAALHKAGLRLKGPPLMDGQMHRVEVEGDRGGERSGAYVGHLDGRPAGFIQNHRDGGEKTTWRATGQVAALSAQDRATMIAVAAEARQQRTVERERTYERTAYQTQAIWNTAEPAVTHPYLEAKGVQAHGLRQDERANLLVPVQDIDGKLWSLQRIEADGSKRFKLDGRVDGGHHVIGDLSQPGPLLIAEGYATAAELYELTGQPTVVAFNAGNLPKVAAAYRERNPDRQILIAGDNDHLKESAGKHNVGREKAEDAARLIGGATLLPSFSAGSPGSDWNDLARSQGREKVQLLLQAAFRSATRDQVAAGMAASRSDERSASLASNRTPKKELEREAGVER